MSCWPPSISNVAPVTAVFVIRWMASAAMSAAPMTRRIGKFVSSWLRRALSRSPSMAADCGVSTNPAAITFTRMGASSAARLFGHRRERSGDRGDERASRDCMPTVGAPREEQRSTWADRVDSPASDLQGEQQVRIQVASRFVDVEVGERQVVGAWTGDQHVIDGRRQLVEKPLKPVEVGRVEGGDAALDVESGALHTLGVACRDDHLGSLVVGATGGLQADAGAAADHEEHLPGELRVASAHVGSAALGAVAMAVPRRLRPERGRRPPVTSAADTRSACAPRCGVAPGERPSRHHPGLLERGPL